MAGAVTCSAALYREIGLGLAYVVQAPIALVLDQPEVQVGSILGVLCASDVVVPSSLDLPWLMLPAGSFVRHPKMRTGRIKLHRPGWMVVEHQDFGRLLQRYPTADVERGLAEGSFERLPLVRVPGKPPAEAPQSAKPPPAESHDRPAPRSDLPRAPPAAPAEHAVSGVSEPTPAAAAEVPREFDPPHRNERDSPEGREPHPLAAGALSVQLSVGGATALLDELLEGYSSHAFRAAARRLDESWASDRDRGGRMADVDALCLRLVLGSAIQRLGFSGDAAGMKAANGAVFALSREHPQLMERHRGIQRLIFACFPSCFGMDSAADRRSPHDAAEAAPEDAADAAAQDTRQAADAPEPPRAQAAEPPRAEVLEAPRERVDDEDLAAHLRRCGAAHFRVVHQVVFVRDGPSIGAGRVNVCHGGCRLCTGGPARTALAPEGEWVRCGAGALLWRSPGAAPEPLLAGAPQGFILLRHREHGVLIERCAAEPPPDAAERGAGTERGGAEAAEAEAEAMPELASVDHWVVEAKAGAEVRQDRATSELRLRRGDVVVLPAAPELSAGWLALPAGTRVFRGGARLLALARAGRVAAEEGRLGPGGVVLRTLAAFGDPWVVDHDQVVVRSAPATTARAVGILSRGDVLGARRVLGEWVELARDASVRLRLRGGHGAPHGVNEVRSVRMARVKCGDAYRYETFAAGEHAPESGTELWMMIRHPELGQLLHRCENWSGELASCVVAEDRLALYRAVVELCHRRIFEDNLESLWEGDRAKLPTPRSLEAKLFDASATVIHATVDDEVAGGAILKEVFVLAHAGESGVNVGVATAHQSHTCPGTMAVGYIDSFAAEVGLHAGSAIWQAVAGMPFVCVACHSILLPSTVGFWHARGMRRYEPSSRDDREAFTSAILLRTQGTVKCELADLCKALPARKLPLLVWIPKGIGELDSDPRQAFYFTPDCPEDASASAIG